MSDEQPRREITLDQFLKYHGVADTGGRAKWMIQEGMVRVNGDLEKRRGRKLQPGDVVEAESQRFTVE